MSKSIIEFFTPDCAPCKVLAPYLCDAAWKVKVDYVNAAEADAMVREYNIMQVPTLIFFENFAEVGRATGMSDATVAKIREFAQ